MQGGKLSGNKTNQKTKMEAAARALQSVKNAEVYAARGSLWAQSAINYYKTFDAADLVQPDTWEFTDSDECEWQRAYFPVRVGDKWARKVKVALLDCGDALKDVKFRETGSELAYRIHNRHSLIDNLRQEWN